MLHCLSQMRMRLSFYPLLCVAGLSHSQFPHSFHSIVHQNLANEKHLFEIFRPGKKSLISPLSGSCKPVCAYQQMAAMAGRNFNGSFQSCWESLTPCRSQPSHWRWLPTACSSRLPGSSLAYLGSMTFQHTLQWCETLIPCIKFHTPNI